MLEHSGIHPGPSDAPIAAQMSKEYGSLPSSEEVAKEEKAAAEGLEADAGEEPATATEPTAAPEEPTAAPKVSDLKQMAQSEEQGEALVPSTHEWAPQVLTGSQSGSSRVSLT